MTTIDPAGRTGKIATMFRGFIANAMRSSIEEVLAQPLAEIRDGVKRLEEGQLRLEARLDRTTERLDARIDETNARITQSGARLEARIDDTNKQMAALGTRLDARIDEMGHRLDDVANRFEIKFDELSAQQGRLVEEVAGLRTDRKLAETLEHRLARIEDRVFAKAG